MKRLGFIGFGNMGSCLAKAFKSQVDQVWIFDKDIGKTKNEKELEVAESIDDLLENVVVVVLSIKPQDFGELLDQIKNNISSKLIISIAAGITTSYIEKYLGQVRVVRTMPNMAAKIKKGITCLYKGRFAKEDDLLFTRRLFDSVGQTLILDSEDKIDAATAISGSGPGYFFDLIHRKELDINNEVELDKFKKEFTLELMSAASNIGFEHEDALKLAEATTIGSVELLKSSNLSAQELVNQIASKGGTTEAALGILRTGGTLKEAVLAARNRAGELSRR